jgi:predicted DNA-binding protein with PD1-like motif
MKKLSITLLAACLSAAVSQPVLAQTKKIQPQKSRREESSTNRVKTYVLRLKPGQDLRVELEQFTKSKNIRAGFIVTCVGSLRKAALRLADKSDATDFDGKFEIVSLVGTLSPDGPHLHISISDGTGKTIGGHLVAGCEIYTTAEIVIGDALGLKMTREPDTESGYKELKIRNNTPTKKP